MPLIRTPQLSDPYGFYEELVRAQRDLPDEEAQKVLAKLVLLLANHVGDRQVLSEAIALASQPRGTAQGATQTPGAAAR